MLYQMIWVSLGFATKQEVIGLVHVEFDFPFNGQIPTYTPPTPPYIIDKVIFSHISSDPSLLFF